MAASHHPHGMERDLLAYNSRFAVKFLGNDRDTVSQSHGLVAVAAQFGQGWLFACSQCGFAAVVAHRRSPYLGGKKVSVFVPFLVEVVR